MDLAFWVSNQGKIITQESTMRKAYQLYLFLFNVFQPYNSWTNGRLNKSVLKIV